MNTGGEVVNSVGSENFHCKNTSRKCYICGHVEHIQRNCPQQCCGKPVEACRSPPVSMQGGQNWTMTNHVVGEDKYTKTQERILQLQKELQAAEAKNALLDEMVTMHVLTTGRKPEGLTLGPTVLVNALLGHPVKASVDTGSPITIVSIKCLLDILAKNRIDDQTVQNWK